METTRRWILSIFIFVMIVAKPAYPHPDPLSKADQDTVTSGENLHSCSLEGNKSKNPCTIRETPLSQIWYKQEKIPGIHVRFEIFCPQRDLLPTNRLLTEIFIEIFNLKFKDLIHADDRFENSVTSSEHGILVNFQESADSFTENFEKLLLALTTHKSSQTTKDTESIETVQEKESFETAKNKLIQSLKDSESMEPQIQATNLINQILKSSPLIGPQVYKIIESLKYENLVKFLPKLFSSIFVQGLVVGHCTEEHATNIADVIENSFEKVCRRKVLKNQILPAHIAEINEGANWTFTLFNKTHETYGYAVYYQVGRESVEHNPLAFLMAEMIYSLFFKDKTVESLTKVEVDTMQTNGVLALLIRALLTQEPTFIDSRLEDFLSSVPTEIEKMGDSDFENNKAIVITRMLKKPEELQEICDIFWYEISNRFYLFDRIDVEVNQLKSATKMDILTFFKNHLDKSTNKQRKLSVHVYPEKDRDKVGTMKNEQEFGTSETDRMADLKSSSSLHPVPSSRDHLGSRK